MKKPRPRAIKQRATKTATATQPTSALAVEAATAAPERTKPRTAQFWEPKFWSEVRAEAGKISWPSRKETTITSVMVFLMVIITGVFFLFVDLVLHWGIDSLLKLANSGSLS
jgi:preprotein translocase subunit SecE